MQVGPGAHQSLDLAYDGKVWVRFVLPPGGVPKLTFKVKVGSRARGYLTIYYSLPFPFLSLPLVNVTFFVTWNVTLFVTSGKFMHARLRGVFGTFALFALCFSCLERLLGNDVVIETAVGTQLEAADRHVTNLLPALQVAPKSRQVRKHPVIIGQR